MGLVIAARPAIWGSGPGADRMSMFGDCTPEGAKATLGGCEDMTHGIFVAADVPIHHGDFPQLQYKGVTNKKL